MASPIDYKELYKVQDHVLDLLFAEESIFYLTGGTCINRFHSDKRHSDDLDFFTSHNNLFRENIRNIILQINESATALEVVADSKDFVRLVVNNILQVDFVNDRTFYYGKTVKSEKGYVLDNPFNMLGNKISAVVGRDEPKDVFDLFLLSTITEFNWNSITEISRKKELFEPDILEYRLKTFPLSMLDRLVLIDKNFLPAVKAGYDMMINDIISGNENSLFRKY
jgi:predicted nucleotidyltransferase component of viral defense system